MSSGSTFRFPAPKTFAADAFEKNLKSPFSPGKNALVSPQLSAKSPLAVSSPETDYFTLKSIALAEKQSSASVLPAPCRKPPFPAQNSGSISSLGSEATLSSSTLFTDHSHSLSTETLVDTAASPRVARHPVNLPALGVSFPNPLVALPYLSLNLSLCGGSPMRPRHNAPEAEGFFESSDASESKESKGPSREAGGFFRPTLEESRNHTEPLCLLNQTPPIPTLRKQHTLPSLSMRAPPLIGDHAGVSIPTSPVFPTKKSGENAREAILKLSPTISYISPDRASDLLLQSLVSEETGLRDVLVLDIRSFADYVKSHVSGAINICLPSTLLKRATFNLNRCVVSLPTYEKVILQNYFLHNHQNFDKNRKVEKNKVDVGAHGLPAIILYDTVNTSTNILHMCKKLVDFSCYDASSAPPIYLIDCPFLSFSQLYSDKISLGSSDLVDLGKLSISLPVETTSESPKVTQPRTWPRFNSSTELPLSGKEAVRTPIISNFSLPKNLPQSQFKIRHNEQKFDFSAVSEEDISVPLTSPEAKLLPQWLRDSVANSKQICLNFKRLEECEKLRLNSAFKLRALCDFTTPGGGVDKTPVINSGLDYGHKNRYKDIFLYEHSRVSLSDLDGEKVEESQLDCDYINASYLRPFVQNEAISRFLQENHRKDTQLNYLATQGPMLKTAGDFWRCVYNQKCLVVVSLTGETDNGVEKCFAFWKPGSYFSDKKCYKVTVLETQKYKSVVVRRFSVEREGVQHHVTQMHLSTWQDMTSDVNTDEILYMVKLKRQILNSASLLPSFPSAIHCSAGCGRTGVFVVADTLINTLGTDQLYNLPADPIYEIVNDLRKQRISMVQTLRQYSLIYNLLRESIVKYDSRTDFQAAPRHGQETEDTLTRVRTVS